MPDRVLVVDDDESLLELCETSFKLDGYHVDVAPSGESALKKLDASPYDLVVTDLFMPGKVDGSALVRTVKARFPSTEVVVMTAVPTLKTAIGTLKDGASDYIIKPFETDHLRVIAKRSLEHRKLRRELDSERTMRQELASAYKELQKVEELKESFLARVSHELRTPLSELLTAVELMEQAAGSTTDQQKLERYVSLSKQGAARMDHILSDLLAFVELQKRPVIERGAAVPVEPLCREVVAKLKPIWEKRGISVELKLPADLPAVAGDRELLGRALEHLLHNAIVFNKDQGRITLEGRAEAGNVYVDLTDTGEGIPEAEFDRIFDSFYQIANYLTRKVGGLGLGLAITRRIAEAHGGYVDVKSKLGEGTTFRLRLPIKA